MGLNLRIKDQKSEPNLIILPLHESGIFILKNNLFRTVWAMNAVGGERTET